MRMVRPVLWRQGGEVQVGAAPGSLRLTGLSDPECDLLLDIGAGAAITRAEAEDRGIDSCSWLSLQQVISGPLQLPKPFSPPRLRPVPLDQSESTRAAVTALEALPHEPAGELAILTDWYVSDPLRIRPLMRADRSFLPLVLDDDGATVGPITHPGLTACPGCLELARTDEDPRWPVVATQLRMRGAGRLDRLLTGLVGAAAVLVQASGPGWGWRITREGIGQFTLEPHPDCGCLGPAEAPTG
ncbi:MAG: hypothetical protein Q4G64_07520 [bacterium]|nr:hypothetical protein [bacterium]